MPSRSRPASSEPTKRSLPAVLLSFAMHLSAVVFVVLLGNALRSHRIEPAPFRSLALVETAGGTHAVRIPLPPSNFAAHTRQPTAEAEASHKTLLPVEQDHPKVSGGGAPKLHHSGDGSSTAVAGNGSDAEDATPAFPVFSPRPPVNDRSLLPAGEKKIVVDVNVDALGQVVHETLVKGMGTRLDQIVLDVVKTWRFQPATVNGKPQPSEAELVFPFTPSYPITDS